MASSPDARGGSWLRRVGWMVLIWTASVLALAVVAMLLRVLMNLAGLTA